MSTRVYPGQSLRKVFVVAALLAIAAFPTLHPSASTVAHAAAVQRTARSSDTPAATQTNTSANAGPRTVYTVANCVQPPNNVDHATFTDAQLATYGLPSRSSFRTTEAFDTAVRAMKYRDCQYTIGSPAARFGEIKKTTAIWAGYYEYGGNWTTEIAEWYMNQVLVCDSTLRGRDGNWGGIGGVGSNNLVQSGSVGWCDDPISGNPNAVWYQMWVENVGDGSNPGPEYASYQPRPGDLMESLVGGSNGCNYMNVTDITTGQYFPRTYGPCAQQYYFDCIEENDAYGLAVNGTVDYPYCEGYDAPQSKWLVMGNSSSNYYDVTMVNQNTDAIPSSPPNQNGEGSFSVTWNSND